VADLKKVYTSPNKEAALFALEELRETWSSKYPQMLKVGAARLLRRYTWYKGFY